MSSKISILSYSLLLNKLGVKSLFVNKNINKEKKYKFVEYEKDSQSNSIFLAIQRKKQLIKKIVNSNNSHNIDILKKVYNKGCRAFIIDSYYYDNHEFRDAFDAFIDNYKNELDFVLITKNSTDLYYQIANIYRKIINPIVIAVTGSVGKTSTTEMIYRILSMKHNVHKSNVFNTLIAISRAVVNMPINTEYLVIEVSSRRTGLMQINSKILEPDIAVITQIKYEHVKGMGTIDGIANEKLSITNSMNENGLLICPNIEPIKNNLSISYEGEISLISINQVGQITEYVDKSEFYYKNKHYILNEPGRHNIDNSILSIETCMSLGLKPNQIFNGLTKFRSIGNRWSVENLKNDIVVINDSPNNPSHATVMASINTLVNSYKEYKKIIILSDILELGEYEQMLYEDIGQYINKLNIDELILYGDKVHQIQSKIKNKLTRIKFFKKVISEPIDFKFNGELTNYIGPLITEKTVILIKASRVMGFDKIAGNIIKYVND